MKTKIIATIGPKTDSQEALVKMIEAGTDMIRFNFSHASYEQFEKMSKAIRKISKASGKEIKIIQDLQGPRIRIGKLPEKGIALEHDMRIGLAVNKLDVAAKIIPINDSLYKDIKKGEPIFLANGAMELAVTEMENKIIWCQVVKGGLLTSGRSVNIPDTNIKKGGLTEKDIENAKFALKTGNLDYIALSFVQTVDDVFRLKELIKKYAGRNKVEIISKIERGVALRDIDRIIAASDAIMVARGDLGIEVPIENLPLIQKNLVRHAHWHNTPAIIATQVLTSMIEHQNPTRAEISDISNAVFDEADALMLSDETAVGAYPIESIKMLRKVIKRTENYLERKNFFDEAPHLDLINGRKNKN